MKIHTYTLLSFTILLASCAGPNTKSISNFGQKTTQASSIITDAGSLQNELNLESEIIHQACHYIKGQEFRLAKSHSRATLSIIEDRLVFSRALVGYAEALASADNPDAVDAVRKAASSLSSSLGSSIKTVSRSSSSSVTAGPIINLFLNGIVRVDEAKRRRAILAIASEVNDVLFVVEKNFTLDQDIVDEFLKDQLKNWERQAKCLLHVSRRRQASSYTLFRELDNKKREYSDRIGRIRLSLQVFRAVNKAHNAMVNSPADFDAALTELQTTLADLKLLVDALNEV
jgi:hypothetical protein